jgi:subtilase family serine protease
MSLFKRLSMFSTLALTLGWVSNATAQQNPLLKEKINDANLVVLSGNTRPEVSTATDLGLADDSTPLPALQFVLQRSPEAQAAFTEYVNDLTNPHSANFHKWLTNAEIGTMYGPAQQDIDTVSTWLAAKGFKVNSVSPDRTVIEFSGNAGLVRTVFNAPIHNFMSNGKAQFANINDPAMPSDLTPVVSGIASLNNFMPHPLSQLRFAKSLPQVKRNGADGGGNNFLGAADLATIYNFNTVFASGISGQGQTIMVLEDSNLFSTADWSIFRKVLGLSKMFPMGTLTAENPTGTNTCTSPGVNGDDAEAALDIEWSSAAAPNAAIIAAACADTTQFGGFIALENVLEQTTFPKIVSISFGEAESKNGAAENLFINNLYESAAAQGVSIFVSSGDEGAASADADLSNATHGVQVSGFTSTPFNASVGGTDFGFVPLNTPGTYFNTTDGPNFLNAVSYIPEVPWNDSCAGSLAATFIGFPTTGAGSFCNSTDFGTPNEFLTTGAGSGGPSSCATGTPSTSSVVSGTCKGYAKPSWQSLVGVPSDGVRDIPDVSLMASNGFWGEFYATCISDPTTSPGNGACGDNPALWLGFGGTSISSPIWAGIQALVNQKTGQSWGLPTPVLYALANIEYGLGGDASCNSSLGNQVGSNCVFYDVTQGDNVVNCSGLKARGSSTTVDEDCFIDGGTFGILSVSSAADEPAYSAGIGWDFTTGIGTGNATNVVNAWAAFAAAEVGK